MHAIRIKLEGVCVSVCVCVSIERSTFFKENRGGLALRYKKEIHLAQFGCQWKMASDL